MRLPVVASVDAVVVAKIVVEVEVNVPAVRLAMVPVVAKKLDTIAVAAFKSVAKKVEEVALVVDALVAAKVLVTVAFKRVPLLTNSWLDTLRLVIVELEIVVVARVV